MTDLRAAVRQKYGEAAVRVVSGSSGCCCGTGSDCAGEDAITGGLYDGVTASSLPADAVLASLGCGNPTALAELGEGEVVLDLGSGGGIDVLLSARRVGPTGKVYGLDMTDEMLALARRNAAAAGVSNVEFMRGEIEAIPLPDASVDVIISNCVINLSADKGQVLREAFRVLKPGGRFAVSDIVVRGSVPEEVRRSMELWVGCVAGALEEDDFRSLLLAAGFEAPEVEPTRVYSADDARGFLAEAGLDYESFADAVDGRFMAAFVRARKPVTAVPAATARPATARPATLRPAEPEDLASIETLLAAASLPTAGLAEWLAEFVVAEAEGVVVGVAGLERYGNDGLLRSVAVAESWRGHGLGAVLTEAVLDRARERGLSSVYLLTTTAEGYFPRQGFRRIDRSEVPAGVASSAEFSDLCPASAVVMVLELAPAPK